MRFADGLVKVDIRALPGDIRVEVNGEDVTRSCVAARLDLCKNDVPRLTLELMPNATYEGAALVQVAEPLDTVSVIERFLDAVDPQELEEKALQGSDLGTSVGQSFLQALREMIT